MTSDAHVYVFPRSMFESVVEGFALTDSERTLLDGGTVHRFGYSIRLSPPVPTFAEGRQIDATIARLGSRNLFAQIPYRTLARLQGRAAR